MYANLHGDKETYWLACELVRRDMGRYMGRCGDKETYRLACELADGLSCGRLNRQ